MPTYPTHKDHAEGRARTLAFKQARMDKYAPRNSSGKNAR